MPEQSYPPYAAGALTVPRSLNRWLDINPQGGPLRRVETYITLPVFNVAASWLGYSNLVAAFNFEGPNNFSLMQLAVPISPNYAAFVAFVKGGKLTRYLLWNASGSLFYFQVIPYVSQTIGKNFRIEIWNTSAGVVSNTLALNQYTSVAGQFDYRHATDSSLVSADAIVTNFSESITAGGSLPNGGSYGQGCDLLPSNLSGTDWHSVVGNFDLTSANAELVSVANGNARFTGVGTSDAAFTGTVASNPYNYIWILVYNPGFNGVLVQYGTNPAVNSTTTGFSCDGASVVVPTPGWYLVYVDYVDGFISVTAINTQVTVSATFSPPSITNSTAMTVLAANSTCVIQELTSYILQATSALIYNYFFNTYAGFQLPLTFPANSVSLTN